MTDKRDVVIVSELRPGSSMTLVGTQIWERLKDHPAIGSCELVDCDDKALLKAIHQKHVISMNYRVFKQWMPVHRFVHPYSVMALMAGNWEELTLPQRLEYLALLFKPTVAGVPVVHVSHSHYTTHALLETARQYLNAQTVKALLPRVLTIPYGVEQDFAPGVNDPRRHIVPYNRVQQAQKNIQLHRDVTLSFLSAAAAAKTPVEVDFYVRDPVDGDIGPYTHHEQPKDRATYLANAGQYGMFLSTSLFESFGIMYLELLLAGVVGVFLDRPWIRKLLPDYPYVAGAADLAGAYLHTFQNLDAANTSLAPIRTRIREYYNLDRFCAEFADAFLSMGPDHG